MSTFNCIRLPARALGNSLRNCSLETETAPSSAIGELSDIQSFLGNQSDLRCPFVTVSRMITRLDD